MHQLIGDDFLMKMLYRLILTGFSLMTASSVCLAEVQVLSQSVPTPEARQPESLAVTRPEPTLGLASEASATLANRDISVAPLVGQLQAPAVQEKSVASYPTYIVEQSKQIAALDDQVRGLISSVSSLSGNVVSLKQSTLDRLWPAIFGFLGIVVGGIINYVLHRRQLTHNENERKEKFSFEIKQGVFEFRGRQNNEFYGPLLVLLAQSKELSMQLHRQLANHDPKRYVFEPEPGKVPEKPTLQVLSANDKQPFRLIEEMPRIGSKLRDLLPQVQVIIDVGVRMATLIEKSSGLAVPTNLKLHECLGLYLAHLAALQDAYNQVKQAGAGKPVRLHTAVFPRDLQGLVKQDYEDINRQIKEWEDKADGVQGGKI